MEREMTLPPIPFLTLCTAVLAALALVPDTGRAQEAPRDATAALEVTAREISGSVEARPRPEGAFSALRVGDSLRESAQVRTAQESSALLRFEAEDEVRLTENTDIVIRELYRLSRTKKTITAIDLETGRILSRIRGQRIRGGSRFEVRTPTATSSVRGTRFAVSYFVNEASQGVTLVEVWEGEVAVQDRLGNETAVRNGSIQVTEGIGLGEPQRLSGAEVRELDRDLRGEPMPKDGGLLEGFEDMDRVERELDRLDSREPVIPDPILQGEINAPHVDDSSDDDDMRP